MKRRSALSSLPTPKLYGPAREGQVTCVGCEKSLNPGMSYTGSILDGMSFATLKGTERTPIKMSGVIDTPFQSYPILVGGDLIHTSKNVSFYKRRKGYICDTCASNYKGLTDSNGTFHPFVKTDPRPGWAMKEIIIPVIENIPTETKGGLPKLSSGNPSMRTSKLDRPLRESQQALSNQPDNHWLNVGRKR